MVNCVFSLQYNVDITVCLLPCVILCYCSCLQAQCLTKGPSLTAESRVLVMMSIERCGLRSPLSLPEPRSQVKCEDTGPDHPRLPHKKHRPMSAPGDVRLRSSWGIMPAAGITGPPYKPPAPGDTQLGPGPALSTNHTPVWRSRDPARPMRGLEMAGAGPIRGRDGGSLREERRPGPR